MTLKATYHCPVCSDLREKSVNDTINTVEYRYNYHYCTYVQCVLLPYFPLTRHQNYDIENAIV